MTSPALQDPRRAASPAWWLMLALAAGIAAYGMSFMWRGVDAFPDQLLTSFYRWPWAIWFHVAFGGIALVTGALNFRHSIRRTRPAVHRRLGEIYLLSCALLGSAGLFLSFFAYGGLANRLGFLGLAVATLITTSMAYRAARARRFNDHRRWMIRSYAMILAAVTLRIELPLLAVYFQAFDPAYRIVAWSCWVPNLVVAEWLARRPLSQLSAARA